MKTTIKKLLSFMTLFAVIISVFSILCIPSSANTEFTQQDAANLFIDALNRVATLYTTKVYPYPEEVNYIDMIPVYHHTGTVYGYIPKDTIQTECMVGNIKDYGIYTFDKSTDGTLYRYPISYNRITDERFNTMEKISDYLTEVFTYQAAQCALKRNGRELVRPSEGGTEYTVVGTQTTSRPGYVAICTDTVSIEEVSTIGELQVYGNTATLYVVVENEKPRTVEFKKTEAGWRISGGGYFTSIFGVFETPDVESEDNMVSAVNNPATGSTALIYIALSMLSLSVACVAVTKKKRK